MRLGRLEEALEAFGKTLDIDPGDIEAMHNKANVLCRLNRFQEALKLHNRLLDLDPYHLNAICDKSLVLYFLHRHEEALESYRSAKEIDEDNVLVRQLERILRIEDQMEQPFRSSPPIHLEPLLSGSPM